MFFLKFPQITIRYLTNVHQKVRIRTEGSWGIRKEVKVEEGEGKRLT